MMKAEGGMKNHGFRLMAPAFGLVVLTLIAYLPAGNAGFIWDDAVVLRQNKLISADDGIYRLWYASESTDYMPVTDSVRWLQWHLWGARPAGYHLTNVLLHAGSAVLVWLLLKRLRVPAAWWAGMIFAVYPVCVASVAWVTEMKNCLSQVLFLLAILLYLKFDAEERRRYFYLSMFAFLLALLSKGSVVVLPFVLLGCIWWLRGVIAKRDVLRCIPFLALAVVMELVTVWFQYSRAFGYEALPYTPIMMRVARAGMVVWFYLYKALLPADLIMVYPRWEIDVHSPFSYVPGLIIAGLFYVLFRYRKSWGRPLLFGLGYCVVTLLPVIGFFEMYYFKYSFVADHWQYLSIIGVIALVVGLLGYAVSRLTVTARTVAVALACLVIVVLGAMTWGDTLAYRNGITLWTKTLRSNPRAAVGHAWMGMDLVQAGLVREGIAHIEEATRLDPDEPQWHIELGTALSLRGRYEDALHLREAARLIPGSATVQNNLGLILIGQGKPAEAADHLSIALRLKPDLVSGHSNLAQAYTMLGKSQEAIAELRRALELSPNSPSLHNHNEAH